VGGRGEDQPTIIIIIPSIQCSMNILFAERDRGSICNPISCILAVSFFSGVRYHQAGRYQTR